MVRWGPDPKTTAARLCNGFHMRDTTSPPRPRKPSLGHPEAAEAYLAFATRLLALTTITIVTLFPDQWAKSKDEQWMSLNELADLIGHTTAPSKNELPYLKLASFGDNRTDKNCLRSN